ncbi:hypothetical protein PV327_001487 [Microctonus hyperodae]|uniref:VPS9 domain-containing protein n=1 Tax=Microctonus hyperodae TaxID=165561 RepID=A0AA39L394_MICHY|nr:hypothetical protein PV327_001487 [Microctonus hyperodae]
MEVDEIMFNPFYLVLREKFKAKYDVALSKCLTICIPCTDSLRGLNITDEFVDDHILKPLSRLPYHYESTNLKNPRIFKFEDDYIRLIQQNGEFIYPKSYKIKILNIERGYNKDFKIYNIVIVDKLLHEKYVNLQKPIENKIKLNRIIASYKDALNFLQEIATLERCSLIELAANIKTIDPNNYESSNDLGDALQEWIRRNWAQIMRKFNLDIQRDGRFQKLLSTSLEIFIMHELHDKIYSLLNNALDEDDLNLKKKIDELIGLRVTPDQLGVKEALAISLPCAIVELATLDARHDPLEKFTCLKSTLDLIIAEIKGALADVETKIESYEENDLIEMRNTIKIIPTDDLIPLLIYVIVKSRPRRLITDLHYIQNFLWSVSPYDGLSYTIVTYKTAITALQKIAVDNLPSRSHKVKNDLSINEILDFVKLPESTATPIDRQVHELAMMLKECTKNDAVSNFKSHV